MVTCKPSVRFKRLTPAIMTMLNALCAADAWPELGQPEDVVVTSANDSKHLATSRHYTDEALDVRSRTFTLDCKEVFRKTLERRLGMKFRVLLEGKGTPNEHFHCQVRKGQSFP